MLIGEHERLASHCYFDVQLEKYNVGDRYMHPDSGYHALLNLIADATRYGDLSESDTRSKLIDYMLKECLGYSEYNIQRESHVESGRLDYSVKINGIPFLVIEAKKEGEYFEIPKSWGRRYYKINGTLKTNENLLRAMQQARAYCVDSGIKFAIVTNGTQYVAFIAFTPGKKWEDGNCVIYNGYEDIKDNFSQFWNTFSYEALENGSFLCAIEDRKSSLLFRKLSSELHNPDQKWERNRIYTYLADIVDFVFTELLDQKKTAVLRKCYVFERANEDLGKDLDSLFLDKMPHFSKNYNIQSIVETETKAGAFEKKIRELRKNENELPMVVLLGGIGSGKSTFIHRFFRIIMEERESLFWYYLDFRYSSFDEGKVEEYIYDQIIAQFKETYYDKISEKLESIGFSLEYNNKYEYINRLFAVQKVLRISPILIIDNVDQHEYTFQEKLFLFANRLCKELNVLTILALREETFIKSTRTGVFGAYMISKYHISSPNFINMVKARIQYSLELLHNEEYLTHKQLEADIVVELIRFFEILLRSFNKDNEQSQKIVHFFDSISVGNMREALRMFNSFLISGNTNIDDMLKKEYEHEHDTFQIAFHQLLKSITLGEYRFYSSKRSHIANLFDFDTSLSDSHFNKLRILRYLDFMKNSESPVGRGYISLDELFTKAEEVMISRAIITDSIIRMLKFNLLSLDNQSNETISGASYIAITASGSFYLNRMIYQFIYLHAVIVDTPISNSELIRSIRFSLNESNVVSRITNTRDFLIYLKDSESEEFMRNPQFLQSSFSNIKIAEKICDHFNELVSFLISKGTLPRSEEYFA